MKLDEENFNGNLLLILVAGIFGLVVPNVITQVFGLYWGGVANVVAAVAWVFMFPKTCMSGGFLYSILTMGIVMSAFLMLCLSLIKFVTSLWL